MALLSNNENGAPYRFGTTGISPDIKLAASFSSQYHPVTSISLSKDEYCLHLTHDTSWEDLAVATSDNLVTQMKKETLMKVSCFDPHQELITGVKFSRSDRNVLWTSSLDGSIKVWDLRSNQCEKEFIGMTKNSTVSKPITCFDISKNERILCGGTELVEEGAFILFWDIRGSEVLGSYWESVTDDITQVAFSPEQDDVMATSSTDGLINVFDVSQNSEDDALTYCLNAEVAVTRLTWVSEGGKCEKLAVTTDIETLQYWDIKEAAPMYNISRQELGNAMKCEDSDECYLVSINEVSEGCDPIILAGFHTSGESDCLRTLKFDLRSGQLRPHGTFLAKQQLLMTRTSLYHTETDTFVTGGECGLVRLWRPEVQASIGKESVIKMTKKKRAKPY